MLLLLHKLRQPVLKVLNLAALLTLATALLLLAMTASLLTAFLPTDF